MASHGRLQEAEKHINEAEKCLKSGWFKSADYASAASHFDKAAICFRNSREHMKAKDAYIQAAECHYSNHAIYHAGKSMEQAANAVRDAKLLEEAASLYKRACDYYNESGHPDTAGQVLMRGAQLLQHENPSLAARYFLATADYYELDEKVREAGNSIKNAVRMYCRARPRQYDDIIKTARLSRAAFLRAGAINLAHEAVAVEILAMLMKEQALDALDVLQDADSVPEFSTSDDRAMLEQLIEAVSQNDDESVSQYCDSGIFKSMDPEFAKLARDLKMGGDSVESSQPPSSSSSSSKSTTAKTASKARSTSSGGKKKPSELADMRNQLFTKSTGEKVSSKMPKPRGSAYKPPTDSQDPEPRALVPEPRGLEEQPPPVVIPSEPSPPNDDQVSSTLLEEDQSTNDQHTEQGDTVTAEVEGQEQEDEEDEPLDIN